MKSHLTCHRSRLYIPISGHLYGSMARLILICSMSAIHFPNSIFRSHSPQVLIFCWRYSRDAGVYLYTLGRSGSPVRPLSSRRSLYLFCTISVEPDEHRLKFLSRQYDCPCPQLLCGANHASVPRDMNPSARAMFSGCCCRRLDVDVDP